MAEQRASRSRRKLGLITAAIIFLFDQLLKWVMIGPLDLQTVREIELTSFFNLRWVENYGVSMGFLTAGSALERWLLVGMTATIATVVLVWMWREKSRPDTIALGLVLGGALGNIVDRARFGYVVDFLGPHIGDWYPFLVFNVADAAITIGVLLLVLRAFLTRDRSDPAEKLNA
ncbi:signal peptidase II [Sphingomonas laterariae]|uniref:Lipoprotein signal peptidase n=1 Tax=Edaphosphingomonas laterariae TaxID=861865 RepID=A0A239F169_9SPHN|nr:signal peptidase II [Sphingomonas laterariae]SNS50577.1 signal peptidase II [Sphingomonas laterariae]